MTLSATQLETITTQLHQMGYTYNNVGVGMFQWRNTKTSLLVYIENGEVGLQISYCNSFILDKTNYQETLFSTLRDYYFILNEIELMTKEK